MWTEYCRQCLPSPLPLPPRRRPPCPPPPPPLRSLPLCLVDGFWRVLYSGAAFSWKCGAPGRQNRHTGEQRRNPTRIADSRLSSRPLVRAESCLKSIFRLNRAVPTRCGGSAETLRVFLFPRRFLFPRAFLTRLKKLMGCGGIAIWRRLLATAASPGQPSSRSISRRHSWPSRMPSHTCKCMQSCWADRSSGWVGWWVGAGGLLVVGGVPWSRVLNWYNENCVWVDPAP